MHFGRTNSIEPQTKFNKLIVIDADSINFPIRNARPKWNSKIALRWIALCGRLSIWASTIRYFLDKTWNVDKNQTIYNRTKWIYSNCFWISLAQGECRFSFPDVRTIWFCDSSAFNRILWKSRAQNREFLCDVSLPSATLTILTEILEVIYIFMWLPKACANQQFMNWFEGCKENIL